MSQIGRELIEFRKRQQEETAWILAERQLVAEVMRIKGLAARLEDELIEAQRALEVHRGKKA